MAASPYSILNACGVCEDPAVEISQPYWWDTIPKHLNQNYENRGFNDTYSASKARNSNTNYKQSKQNLGSFDQPPAIALSSESATELIVSPPTSYESQDPIGNGLQSGHHGGNEQQPFSKRPAIQKSAISTPILSSASTSNDSNCRPSPKTLCTNPNKIKPDKPITKTSILVIRNGACPNATASSHLNHN